MTAARGTGSTRSWPTLFTTLLRGDDLPAQDTAWAMEQIMLGEATPAQVAGFVMALRAKGEAPSEVIGLVTTMLAHAERITVDGPAVDTCGSGGDRAHTVNISTMSAMVVAGTGARVVKHGNRAASSACGSADLLEELGVVVDLAPALVEESVRRAGIGFCFAPRFHPALRHAATARGELGVATVFNFLGPLTNPAQPSAQAVGVADARMAGVVAEVLAARGASALVFRGEDGLDELTTGGPSRVWIVREGGVWETTVSPDQVGLPVTDVAALRGGDARHNAEVARRFLDGEQGPVRDAVLLNAAAALVALEPDDSILDERLPDGLRAGIERAAEAVDSGAARAALDRWVSTSQQLAATGSDRLQP
ncbi:MAG: anthranilate phosphoribosyltransferase [Actinomycetota bacterium]|nr:anthranilate phosphoribosyltransferase [Actinomycetota bacterium]